MPRKYKFVFNDNVPSEVRTQFPEHVEAGPATISMKVNDMLFRLDPHFEIVESEDDYVLTVRKANKPRRPTA